MTETVSSPDPEERNSRRSRARSRALSRLAREKSKRFGELEDEERARLGLGPKKRQSR